MTRKKCKECKGDGFVINPKYLEGNEVLEGWFSSFTPVDYMLPCPTCGGTGDRPRHYQG
jgi:hypothetical protein